MPQFIEEDFVCLREQPVADAGELLQLAFGDSVVVIDEITRGSRVAWTKVRTLNRYAVRRGEMIEEGWIRGQPPFRDRGVLALSMVGARQHDGLVLETPYGRLVLIDGEENQRFAQHIAARFRQRRSSYAAPLDVDAMILAHGHRDPFATGSDIEQPRSRVLLRPRRVYHNGQVGRLSAADRASALYQDMLGDPVVLEEQLFAIDVDHDRLEMARAKRDAPLDRWSASLDRWGRRGPIDFQHLTVGDEDMLFDFLDEEGIFVRMGAPLFAAAAFSGAVNGNGRAPTNGHPNGNGACRSLAPAPVLRLTYGSVELALRGDGERQALLGDGIEPASTATAAALGARRIDSGVMHLRTDGERMLVFTDGAGGFQEEAYRLTVRSVAGEPRVELAGAMTTRS